MQAGNFNNQVDLRLSSATVISSDPADGWRRKSARGGNREGISIVGAAISVYGDLRIAYLNSLRDRIRTAYHATGL